MRAGIRTSIENLIRELKISDPAETCVGTWDGPEGEMRVAIIHETGHVYAVSKEEVANDPDLLFRLPVERIGVAAAIEAVERHLVQVHHDNTRVCEMVGCRNVVAANRGKSIAPGTYLTVCDECAPIAATVR